MTPHAALAQGTAADEEAAKPRLTKPPKLVTFVSAAYPESEKAAGRTAAVVLEIGIGADGLVTDAVVVQSAGAAFDAAAVDAAKRFVFDPAEVNGKPAPIRIRYRYDFVFKEEAPAVASIQGVVRQKTDQKPLAGVEITLGDGNKTVTDEQGRFRFENLTPGKRVVRISRADLKAVQTEENLEAGKEIEAVYELELVPETPAEGEEADDLEIVIVAPKLTKQAVSTRVEANQARRVAGTQGDVLKVVENLPGVARASVGSGALVVWGASPQDTRVYVDGVRVPQLYHFGGLRSVDSHRSRAFGRARAGRLRRGVRARPRRPGERRDARLGHRARARQRQPESARRFGRGAGAGRCRQPLRDRGAAEPPRRDVRSRARRRRRGVPFDSALLGRPGAFSTRSLEDGVGRGHGSRFVGRGVALDVRAPTRASARRKRARSIFSVSRRAIAAFRGTERRST